MLSVVIVTFLILMMVLFIILTTMRKDGDAEIEMKKLPVLNLRGGRGIKVEEEPSGDVVVSLDASHYTYLKKVLKPDSGVKLSYDDRAETVRVGAHLVPGDNVEFGKVEGTDKISVSVPDDRLRRFAKRALRTGPGLKWYDARHKSDLEMEVDRRFLESLVIDASVHLLKDVMEFDLSDATAPRTRIDREAVWKAIAGEISALKSRFMEDVRDEVVDVLKEFKVKAVKIYRTDEGLQQIVGPNPMTTYIRLHVPFIDEKCVGNIKHMGLYPLKVGSGLVSVKDSGQYVQTIDLDKEKLVDLVKSIVNQYYYYRNSQNSISATSTDPISTDSSTSLVVAEEIEEEMTERTSSSTSIGTEDSVVLITPQMDECVSD